VTYLSETELDEFVDRSYTTDLLRVELRQTYGNPADQHDLRAYLRGEPLPGTPWLDDIQQELKAGKTWRVLHAVSHPLTNYLRYECEWGYVPGTAAGEQIRITPLTTPLARVSDLLILDYKHVLRYSYTDQSDFVGAELVTNEADAGAYVALSEVLWKHAEDFTTWWTNHPQYHRTRTAA
jgi:hypothetical protein